MDSAKDRFLAYLTKKGIKIRRAEVMCGFSNASLRTCANLSAKKVETILSVFPDINKIWLLTGVGEMLSSEQHAQEPNPFTPKTEVMSAYSGRPDNTYPVVPPEIAQEPNVILEDWMKANEELVDKFQLTKIIGGCMVVPVKTDELHPCIVEGTYIFVKLMPKDPVRGIANIVNGGCYYVDTFTRGAMWRIAYDRGDHFLLKAVNKRYEDADFPVDDIKNIYRSMCVMLPTTSPFVEETFAAEMERKDEQIDALIHQQDKLIDENVKQGERIGKLINKLTNE